MHTVVTGARNPGENSTIDAYWVGHPTTKGMYAVDGGDTAKLAKVMQKLRARTAKASRPGGFDLTEKTQKLLHEGYIEFTIDQQPYLQGFLPIAAAVPVARLRVADGPGGNGHGPEVPEQRNGHAVRRIQDRVTRAPPRRSEGRPDHGRHRRLGQRVRRRGAPVSASAKSDPRAGAPAAHRAGARCPRAQVLLERALVLREGSIIVVTLLVAIYFVAEHEHLPHGSATSRRCCRTSPRSRSSARARCS